MANLETTDTNGATPIVRTEADESVDKSDWQDAIWKAYNGLVNVRVVTMVGDVIVSARDENSRLNIKVEQDELGDHGVILTEINLIEGDVVNMLSTDLAGNAEIREFHAQQVEGAVTVLPANVQMFAKLVLEGINKLA
jgi:hypothetical protein